MRQNLRYFLLPSFILITQLATAQKDKFAYAITDVAKDGVNWSVLRKINIQTGSFSEAMLNGSDAGALAFDATSNKQLEAPLSDSRLGKVVNAAFGTGVAAIAFDKKTNRLYFTPMLFDQLRYIDLKTMQVYFVGSDFTSLKVKAPDQSNIITRMTIANDGNGYALTNDGKNLVRFSTGKKPAAVDLGMLIDAPENKDVSIYSAATSYGGDMIADDDGNLYVFSARNRIFKINIETKIARYLGIVSGLPVNFTINGAAVSNDNEVLITSAMDEGLLYTVNINTWAATAASTENSWRSSDLANSNLLAVRKVKPIPELIRNGDAAISDKIQLYPNPVVAGTNVSVLFNGQEPGNYTVEVSDAIGKQATRKNVVAINGKGQTETLQLSAGIKKGIYLVKVTDQNSKTVFTKKILVQ